MQIAHQLRHLRPHHALDPRLDELPVCGEIDFRYALGSGKPPLILGRIAAHGTDVVERPCLAAHYPLTDDEIRTRGLLVLGLERGFIEPRRQHVDQIDIAGEFRVLFLGDAAGHEYAEMADTFVDRVDNRLPIGPDLIDVGIAIEDPVQRLLRRGDIVALGAEHHNRRPDVAQVHLLAVGHLDLAGGEIVSDKELVDDELDFPGIQIDVPAPPAFEFEVSLGLGIDL